MNTWVRNWGWAKASACLGALVMMWSCGGSGGTTILTARSVSNAVAGAKDLTAMKSAFISLFTLMALPDDSAKRDLWIQFAEPQLESNGATRSTFEEMYNALDVKMRADPRTMPYALDLTAQDFLDLVNPELPAAYAAPDNPKNAPFVLFSSEPGHVPRAAPVVLLGTQLGVFQFMLLTEIYGRVFVELHPVEIPPATTLSKGGGHQVAPGGSEACKEACQAAFGTCDQVCASAFGQDLLAAGARFRAEAGPQLAGIACLLFGAEMLHSVLISSCRDQDCIDNINVFFIEVIAALLTSYNQALAGFTGGYYDEIAAAEDEFSDCRQSCNQTLVQCLADCHNQGGG